MLVGFAIFMYLVVAAPQATLYFIGIVLIGYLIFGGGSCGSENRDWEPGPSMRRG